MKSALILTVLLTVVGATAAPARADDGQRAAAAAASVAVTTVMPRHTTFDRTVSGYGELVGNPQDTRQLSLPQPGRVARLEVIAGARVHKGQALLRLDRDPAGRMAYAQARHAVAQARAELKQARGLYDRQLATGARLAAARRALADARSALATQKALGGADGTTLRAPVDGVAESIAVHAGQRVAAGAPLLVLAPARGLVARLGVNPARAAAVRVGDDVTLSPVFGGAALRGKVTGVAGSVDPVTRLIDVIVALSRPTALPVSTAVGARIDVGRQPAWAVPRGAVLRDARGAFLFQVAGGVAHRVDVKLIVPAGDTVGVDGPLDGRRPVVVLGTYELHDGMKVRTR